jgi:hypothetical protein
MDRFFLFTLCFSNRPHFWRSSGWARSLWLRRWTALRIEDMMCCCCCCCCGGGVVYVMRCCVMRCCRCVCVVCSV